MAKSPSHSQTPRSTGGIACCLRFSLVAFNLLTLFAGVAVLAVGLLLFFESHVEKSSLDVLEEVANQDTVLPNNKEFQGLAIVLICLGTMVTFISFLGCFGACINGKCLLASYLICVGVILTLQFLVSVFAIIYRQPMSQTLRDELIQHIRHDYRPNTDVSKTWDGVHQMFGCCGVDGYSDWFGIDAWQAEKRVPDSCCMDATNITDCGETLNPNLWYKQGCFGSMQIAMMGKLHYLASVIVTLVFLQLYGIIASTLLFYHAKDAKTTSKNFKTYSYQLARR